MRTLKSKANQKTKVAETIAEKRAKNRTNALVSNQILAAKQASYNKNESNNRSDNNDLE